MDGPFDPARFFDGMYRRADRSADAVPWAALEPSPILTHWLQAAERQPGAAVVVASGLGDDAEALAKNGWYVTAFDISPTAVEWSRERFPESSVDYVVADLFDLPPDWSRAFSLVVEVYTLQSLDPKWRLRAIRAIAELVAERGTLLVSAVGANAVPPVDGPPWPVARPELDGFVTAGLDEVSFDAYHSQWPGLSHLRVEYQRAEV